MALRFGSQLNTTRPTSTTPPAKAKAGAAGKAASADKASSKKGANVEDASTHTGMAALDVDATPLGPAVAYVAPSANEQMGEGVKAGALGTDGTKAASLLQEAAGLAPTPRERAQQALNAVKDPPADHPHMVHMADVRQRLEEAGLPSSADGVRAYVLDNISGRDPHGHQVTRALAGPVGPGRGADVSLHEQQWDVTKAHGSYKLSEPQLQRMQEAHALNGKMNAGDASLDDAARSVVLNTEEIMHVRRSDLAAIADKHPQGQPAVINMSYGQDLARSTYYAANAALNAPPGSKLHNEAMAALKLKDGEELSFDEARNRLGGILQTKAQALAKGELNAGIQDARADLADAVKNANDKGLVVVTTSGNSAEIGSWFGDTKASTDLSDKVPGLIHVGATDLGFDAKNLGDEKMAGFSAHGDVEVSAPGNNVPVAAKAPTTLSALGKALKNMPTGGIKSGLGGMRKPAGPIKAIAGDVDGTSFASPYVSGAVALMMKANPAITPAQVHDILTSKAATVNIAGEQRDGAGALDVVKAVQMAKDLAP